jgi:N-acyl-L-homoserine lactone synthetase
MVNAKIRGRDNGVELRDGSFVARSLDPDNAVEMDGAYAFRYKVFHKELEWSSNGSDGRESDEYDECSAHFGVFSDTGEMLGYGRLTLPDNGFMIEKEFADLLDPGARVGKGDDTAEASRFAISRRLRRSREGFTVTGLLCTTMCKWSRKNEVRYWYMVLDTKYLEFLQQHFPFEAIGAPKEYEPGKASVAARIDLSLLGADEAQTFWGLLGRGS